MNNRPTAVMNGTMHCVIFYDLFDTNTLAHCSNMSCKLYYCGLQNYKAAREVVCRV